MEAKARPDCGQPTANQNVLYGQVLICESASKNAFRMPFSWRVSHLSALGYFIYYFNNRVHGKDLKNS